MQPGTAACTYLPCCFSLLRLSRRFIYQLPTLQRRLLLGGLYLGVAHPQLGLQAVYLQASRLCICLKLRLTLTELLPAQFPHCFDITELGRARN